MRFNSPTDHINHLNIQFNFNSRLLIQFILELLEVSLLFSSTYDYGENKYQNLYELK